MQKFWRYCLSIIITRILKSSDCILGRNMESVLHKNLIRIPKSFEEHGIMHKIII